MGKANANRTMAEIFDLKQIIENIDKLFICREQLLFWWFGQDQQFGSIEGLKFRTAEHLIDLATAEFHVKGKRKRT